MALQSKKALHERLRDKQYRESFIWSRITQTLAIQSRVLRQKAELSQKQLAEALGTSQNAVFRMESPKYGNLSLATLKKWASFFDVGLVVRFAPFSEIADWSQNLASDSINVPDYSHDPGLADEEQQPLAHDEEAEALPRFFPGEAIHPNGAYASTRPERAGGSFSEGETAQGNLLIFPSTPTVHGLEERYAARQRA